MRRLRTWLRVLFASAVLLATVSTFGQDQEDEDAAVTRTAVLSLYLQQDGTARVDFYSSVELNSIPELREALGDALRCNSAAFQAPNYQTRTVTDPQTRRQLREVERRMALHQLTSVCPSPVKHEEFQSTLELSLSPLLEVMRKDHFDALNVSILGSDMPNLRTRKGSAQLNGGASSHLLGFRIPVSGGSPEIQLVWGYQRSDLREPLLVAASFILVPCAVILWVRSRALHLHTTDRAGAWFSYIRTQHLCLTGVLLVWIGGGYSTRNLFTSVLSHLWGVQSLRVAFSSLAYIFVPPLMVLVVSVLSSYRVLVQVRQVSWTFRDFLQLQVAQVGIVMIPALGLYGGISLIGAAPWLALITITLSILFLPFALHLRRKLTGTYPEPVTSGEFLDRIMLLARRAGVTLSGVLVLPSGKLPVANAYASGKGVVMVTDYILQKLNRREVEAVVAHEIGHLQYKHPQKLGAAFVGVIVVPMFFRSLFPALIDLVLLVLPGKTNWAVWGYEDAWINPGLDFLIAGVCLVGFYAISRRFERIADARSVTLTDDPEALITSFVKLSVLNLTPLQWGRASGALTTHPSTLRRVRRIAQFGNVSDARLQELIAEPGGGGETSIPLERFESPLGSDARVYPAQQQLQRANISFLILIAISTIVPTVFAYWAGVETKSTLAILVAGIAATFAIYIPAVRWRIVAGRRELWKKFHAHAQKLYPGLNLADARLVGYSPEAWPRFYYVQSHLDTGMLIPTQEGIVFLGDRVRFRLPQSAIQEMVFEQGISSWWKFRRSYVRWSEGSARGVMNLLSLEPCSVWGIERGNRQLHQMLERWRGGSCEPVSIPAEISSLPLPQPIAWKSKHPRDAYSMKAVIKVVLLAVVAGVFVANATLSFWPMVYVPGVVFLLRLVEAIPYRRYKDRALSSEWTWSQLPVENQASTQSMS